AQEVILLDTDVISGLMRPEVDRRLADWLRGVGEERLSVSAVTVSEIAYGLARLPNGQRKTRLAASVDRLLAGLEIVDFDRAMAARSGSFRAQREAAGRPMSHADSMIAATASALDAQLATRNVRDFAGLDLNIGNPWSE